MTLIWAAFFLVCTGYSIDQCERGHLVTGYLDKARCAEDMQALTDKGAKQGLIIIGQCVDINVEPMK